MEYELIKECHTGKIEMLCECCGTSFLINTGAKREKWCSTGCRNKLVKGKRKPVVREPSVRELVDKYYDDGGDVFTEY